MGSHPLRIMQRERVTSDGEEASRRTAAIETKWNAPSNERPSAFGEEGNEEPERNQQCYDRGRRRWRVQCRVDCALRFIV
jgi:hypothetical protein